MGEQGRKIDEIPDDDWNLAVDRHSTIKRLAELEKIAKEDMALAVAELGLGRSRIFELVRRYRKR